MAERKLNIAIFHLAFLYSGGGERLVLEEAIRLQSLGHNVVCYAPVIEKANCFPELQKRVKMKRLLPQILPLWFPDRELISILAACILSPLFFYKFRKYDIYFGANQPGPWIAFLLSKINKIPYGIYLAQPTRLIHPRLIDQQVGLRLLFGYSMLNFLALIFKPAIFLFDLLSIKKADFTFANGSYAKGVLDEVYRIKTINCPAGAMKQLNVSKLSIRKRFNGAVKIKKNKINKPYVLLTNRHFPHKKFEYALESFKLIKDKRVNLVITGQETEYTRKLIEKYKSVKNIYFVGLLTEKELVSVHKNAAVYVYPAPEEDFGMGIIEAMAYGLPVVAWGNAGPTGIINHNRDGFLARPFEISDFAFYINKVITNKTYYFNIAKNAQTNVRESFDYKKHTKIIEQTFIKTIIRFNRANKKKNLYKKNALYFSYKPLLNIMRKGFYNNLKKHKYV